MHFTILKNSLILLLLVSGTSMIGQDTAIYNVINELFKGSVIKADLILDYVNNFGYKRDVSNDSVDKGITEPPKPGVLYFDRNYFVHLNTKGLIAVKDIDFMIDQVMHSHEMVLDSNRLYQKLLDYRELSMIVCGCNYGSSCLYKYLLMKYNCRSYVSFTNAIFSHDGTRCIIGSTHYSQSKKTEMIYLLEHKENSWKMLKVLNN